MECDEDGWTMVDLSALGARLTTEHLAVVVHTIAQEAPRHNLHDYVKYGLANEVLRYFFGDRWTNENVCPVHPEVSSRHRQGREFLKTEDVRADLTDLHVQLRHRHRVTFLAETLFNLQLVEGLQGRTALVQDNDVQSAWAEFQCAALMAHPDLRFRFVDPVGRKGNDYDGEIRTSSDRVLCCEIECKSDKTQSGVRGLWRSLNHARQQLPKSSPGIVLVRIPDEWVQESNIQQIVEGAVDKALRQSQRLVAAVLVWEEWIQTPGHRHAAVGRFKRYSNTKSAFYDKEVDHALGLFGQINNPSWVPFDAIVAQFGRERPPS